MKYFIWFAPLLCAVAVRAQSYESLHRKFVVADTHNDVLSSQVLMGKDIAQSLPAGNSNLYRFKKGGVDVQVFSVWCGENYGKGTAFAYANREIDSLYSLIHRYPDRIALVRNTRQLHQALRRKQLAALIGVEGGHMIEDRLDYLDSLYKRGMRYLTLTWNNSTSWASSAMDETLHADSLTHKGLTDFGRQVIKRLNELGVMVDVSHAGAQTFDDALAASVKPVIASHSCVYRLCPHFRNLKDAQIRAIAQKGGVVFVNFYSGFLDSTYERKQQRFLQRHQSEIDSLSRVYNDRSLAAIAVSKRYPEEVNRLRPPLSLLIDHIDYIAKLAGVDHVGLGADFDGAESFPQEMDDVSCYPLITRELLKRGYSRRDIKKILGENFIRVLKANTQN